MPKLLLGVVVLGALAFAYFFGPGLLRSSAPEPAVASDAPASKPGDVRVELTEATMSERLHQRLAGQSLGSTPLGTATLKTVNARFQPGLMQFNGNAQVAGRDVPMSVSSTVEVEGGRTVVNVKDATAAGVPLPESARQSMESTLQQQVDQEIQKSGMRVRSVSVAEGKVVLIGSRAP